MKNKKVDLSLDDLRVDSFEIQELEDQVLEQVAGGATNCVPGCTDKSVTCCYPTQGNGTGCGDTNVNCACM